LLLSQSLSFRHIKRTSPPY